MTSPVVVFDTNVLFSALGWKGGPFRCLELARSGQVQGISCREILEELAGKLTVKLEFTPGQTADAIAELTGFLTLVTITGDLRAVPADPKDDMIVECAVVAGAQYIVSGDRRHLLPLGVYGDVQIVSVDTLLTEMGEQL